MYTTVHMHLPVHLDANIKNSFVSVPIKFANSVKRFLNDDKPLASVLALRLGWKDEKSLQKKESFVGWSGDTSKSESLVLSASLAENMNISKSSFFLISVSLVNYSPICSKILIDPVSFSDWEVLSQDSNASFVEDNLLSQLVVVHPNQIFSVFVVEKEIKFKVLEIFASTIRITSHCARMSRDTEVIVAPKVRKKVKKSDANEKPENLSLVKTGILLMPKIDRDAKNDFMLKVSFEVFEKQIKPIFCEREETFDVDSEGHVVHGKETNKKVVFHICTRKAFELVKNLQRSIEKDQMQKTSEQLRKNLEDFVPVLLKTSKRINDFESSISQCAAKTLDVNSFDEVVLSFCSESQPTENVIDELPKVIQFVVPLCQNKDELQLSLINLSKTSVAKALTFFDGAAFDGFRILIPDLDKTTTFQRKYSLNEAGIEKLFKTSEITIKTTSPPKTNHEMSLHLPIQEQIDVVEKLRVKRNKRLQLVYLAGRRQSGKTYVLNYFSTECFANGTGKVHLINCVELLHTKRSIVEKALKSAFHQVEQSMCKSIILIDDLDLLLPKSENKNYDAQTLWLVEYLKIAIDKLRQLESLVTIIATGVEKHTIFPSLLTSEYFSRTIHLPSSLLLPSRVIILKELLRDIAHDHVENETLANFCDGFVVQDFLRLCQKCEIERKSSKKERLEQNELINLFQTFVPLSQIDAQKDLSKSEPSMHWNDIGGMIKAKQTLLDTLQKPLLYKRLFKDSPTSGILLFGASGNGKTALAQSLQTLDLKLNFISVKGPEVLDKYIGASEQNIRNLFQRASNAAPCVLFFDEFEAIAPKRGNDSTGVTDRVVNQLLTYLDGVEKVTGVYVIAATSRPDLLDPALIRGGRLEKHIFLDFPNAVERKDILSKGIAELNLCEEVRTLLDQDSFYESLEGYSNADLMAILSSAQLYSIGDSVDHDLISMENFQKALKESRASVNIDERKKLDLIYNKFMGKREANFKPISGFAADEVNQRVCLK